jgi:ubiquinone/menaquinone biosynthesis C-methylase UbiE
MKTGNDPTMNYSIINMSNSYFPNAYHHVRRRRIAIQLIQKRIKLKPGSLVCDVGCGDGWYSLCLNELRYHVVGIDVSRKRLKKAKSRVNDANFIVGDVNSMPFRDDVFDLIVCAQLLEHIPYPSTVVSECKRIVKFGQFLFFEVPSRSNIIDILIRKLLRTDQSPWLIWGLTIARTHVHFFSQEELLKIFLLHRLSVVEIRGSVALRYTLPLLSEVFWDPEGKLWGFLDIIEGIIGSIPKLKRYGAIQSFVLRKARNRETP